MRYSDVVTPGGGLDGLSGFHMKNAECSHSTHFPQWENGPTVLRAYPAVENGEILPMRYSEQAGQFTPWFVAVRMVKMCGVNDKFTCLTHVKGRPLGERGPIDYFASEIHKAVGKKSKNYRDYPQEWRDWTEGEKGKGAKLALPDRFGLVQGMLFENGKKKYMKEGRPDPLHPVLFCCPNSARYRIERLADTEVEGYNGHPEDWPNRFKIGDVISPEHGRPLQLYHVPASDENFARYGVKVMDHPIPIPAELIKAEWRLWEELLVFLNEEEQMELLLRSFPAPPLDFVFTGSKWEELLPDKVKGAHKAQQTAVPGWQQPGGQPQLVGYNPNGQPIYAVPGQVPGQPVLQPAQAGGQPAGQPGIHTAAHVTAVPQDQGFTPPPAPPQPETPLPDPRTGEPPNNQPAPAQHAVTTPGYTPPPPPAGFQPAQPAQPAAAENPYANLNFNVQTAGQQPQQAQTAPAQPPAPPPQQPAQPEQPPQTPQPSGDPNAAGGHFVNAMEDLRASQERARQRRETPNG